MEYPHSIQCDKFYNEILQWLQENVGNIKWSHPIVSWHGEGWFMKMTPKVNRRGLSSVACYTVYFEDEKYATLFGLWA